MFYLKTTYQGNPIEVPINGEEIYTRCTHCNEELHIDEDFLREILNDDGELAYTTLSCCQKPRLRLVQTLSYD